MNDPRVVRGFQRFGHLSRQGPRVGERDRSARDPRRQVLALGGYAFQPAPRRTCVQN